MPKVYKIATKPWLLLYDCDWWRVHDPWGWGGSHSTSKWTMTPRFRWWSRQRKRCRLCQPSPSPRWSYKIGIVRKPCEHNEGTNLIGAQRPLTPKMSLMMDSYWECLFNTMSSFGTNNNRNIHVFVAIFVNSHPTKCLKPAESHSYLVKWVET